MENYEKNIEFSSSGNPSPWSLLAAVHAEFPPSGNLVVSNSGHTC